MATNRRISTPPMPVREACHARIAFGIEAPGGSELIVEYSDKHQMLARENRPVPEGVAGIDVKTHPEATHIACSLMREGDQVAGTTFAVECADKLQPTGKHFIVIGAMKSGTTTLFRMLSQHPALCQTWVEVPGASFTKEINYFQKLYRKGHSPLHYDWRFPFVPETHAWTLDVSPNYAKLPKSRPVPRRIALLGGETRLAYILRDPVDRIESQVAHGIRHGGKINNLRHCKRISRYALHLDSFVAHIPKENILLLDFELLSRNPDELVAQVCDFLGINRIWGDARVHNKRSVKFRLNRDQRAEILDTLRPDVEKLISEYGFAPAERWLRKPRSSLLRMPRLRR